MPHESADLHVTGTALYTQDLVGRTFGLLHAWPVTAPHAHARLVALDTDAGRTTVPGVVRVLTAADVPGRQRRRGEARRAAVPGRGDVLRPRRGLGAGRDAGGGPAGRGRGRGRVRAAARAGQRARRDRGRELPGQASARSAGATPTRRWTGAPYRFSGELEIGGQEHFYLETQAALALVDENGQIFVQSSTQHPSETQDIVAHVLGLAAHQVTVQCLRMGGGFGGKEFQPHGLAAVAALGATLTGRPVSLRLNRNQDIQLTGKRHPFLRHLGGGLRPAPAAVRAAGHADQQRRLEPRPVRAGAGPGPVPHRQRLLDPRHRGARPGRPRPTAPPTPRSAASAARRA